MHKSSTARQVKPFNLIRWFSLTALASVALVSVLAALLFSKFMTELMIRQEAEITAGFVRSIVATEDAYSYFDGAKTPSAIQLQDFLDHMNRMPGVLRTNVYSADRRVVWSSDKSLIGQRFERNDELEEALKADLVIHSGITDPTNLPKSEHQHLSNTGKRFVESYVPIFDVHGRHVVGVVELYKMPEELFEAIETGVRLIWLVAATAGIFLYAALFWIIYRAHRIMEVQDDQLLENESLAIVGEMGSAVAHGLRNPLSAIRSSAELSLKSTLPPEARECAQDIVAQVDRLEGWVRQLLNYAEPSHPNLSAVSLNTILEETLSYYARDLESQRIKPLLQLASGLPNIRGDVPVLAQLIGSLVANAMETMRSGGELTISSQLAADGQVYAEIRDNGQGIAASETGAIFTPIFTSKANGLRFSLPLVRRLIEHMGGSFEMESSPGKGTAVRLFFPLRT